MLVEMMIAQACLNMSGPAHEACAKAIEAASVQTHIAQDVKDVELRSTALAYNMAASVTGKEALVISAFAVKVVRDKSVTLPIKKNPSGMVPSVTPTLGVDTSSLYLGWKF
jgi:hypothetical protein